MLEDYVISCYILWIASPAGPVCPFLPGFDMYIAMQRSQNDCQCRVEWIWEDEVWIIKIYFTFSVVMTTLMYLALNHPQEFSHLRLHAAFQGKCRVWFVLLVSLYPCQSHCLLLRLGLILLVIFLYTKQSHVKCITLRLTSVPSWYQIIIYFTLYIKDSISCITRIFQSNFLSQSTWKHQSTELR